MRFLKKTGKWVLILLGVVVLAAAGLIGYLSLTEYRPQAVDLILLETDERQDRLQAGERITVVSWNIGYAALGRDQNFFMDGGTMVRPDAKKDVEDNLAGIVSTLAGQKADIYMLQEVDINSHRSYNIDQSEALKRGLNMMPAYATNYRCHFVPFPWPMIGKVESGLLTLNRFIVGEAMRESLPVPFAWPLRVANLKRCLLMQRIPVAGTEKELVLVNLHMEAYDSGEGKKAQTEQLMALLRAEYRKGNYVIAGGDFNQTFPGVTKYPMLNEEYWTPGTLTEADLPAGFSYAFDDNAPTCRLLNENYSGDRENTQFYVIDGFIISANVKVNHIETVDLNFRDSDHHPVRLECTFPAE